MYTLAGTRLYTASELFYTKCHRQNNDIYLMVGKQRSKPVVTYLR